MTKWSFTVSKANREMLRRWLDRAPAGFRLTIEEPKRSNEQSALMWVKLTVLSRELKWHGLTLSAEDYKDLLTAGLRREARMVPNMDGNGFVALGMRTSTMSKAEMGELLDLIDALGAQNGIAFDREDTPSPSQQSTAKQPEPA